MSFIFILDLSDCSASHKSSHFTDFYGYTYIAKFGSKKRASRKKPRKATKQKQQQKKNNPQKIKLNQNNANLTDLCGWILGILDDIAVVRSVSSSTTTTSPLPMPKPPL